ncbi:hypothetical protein IJO12_04575 [bacterium]|nr:hypothetical protein [bacterium]
MLNKTNNISFQGMSPVQIRRFIPSMFDVDVRALSKKLDQQLPNDVLEVSKQNKSQIVHFEMYGNQKLPIRIFNYKGADDIDCKVRFLDDIVDYLSKYVD